MHIPRPARFAACVLSAVLCLFATMPPGQAEDGPRIEAQAAGGWTASWSGSTATISADGYLSSYIVHGVETVGAPFSYQPDAKLHADHGDITGDALTVHLAGKGEATIVYLFRPDGLTITPTWNGGGYAQFRFTASDKLLGIELLNDKSVTVGGDAIHFVTHGEIRGVPAVLSSRNQMVRFHFPGFGLHAYVQTWGAPFNYESAGSIQGFSWGRPLLGSHQAFPIIFTVAPDRSQATLRALPFIPRNDEVCNLAYSDGPCAWSIGLGRRAAYQYLIDAGITDLTCSWAIHDIHDRPVGSGTAPIHLDPKALPTADTAISVDLAPPGSGYYQVLFTLTDATGRMLPSSLLTRFTVIHRIPGMVNRVDDLKGKAPSDYAVVAMIGVGCIRESHGVGDYFSNQPQKGPRWIPVAGASPAVWMDTVRVDDTFKGADAQSRLYHLNWFFQANGRPDYATPAVYQAMAQALVDRCKGLCRRWEVENEPNGDYSPDDYDTKCLVPFATGAKLADPGCSIMACDCVGVKETLRFWTRLFALKADRLVDIFTTHTYPGPGESWEQFGNVSTIRELRSWMQSHGDGAKQLWQTEQGYEWDNPPRIQCARYATRQFLQGCRLGIPPSHQYYFYPQWNGFEGWYQVGGGEVGSEHSWTPVAAAQRFLAENIFGRTYQGDLPSPYKGIYLSRFSGATEDVIAAWTFDFRTVIPMKTSGLISVAGFMGQPVTLVEKGGVYELPVQGEPVYIHVAHGAEVSVPETYGENLALAGNGGIASASSSAPDHPPALANDGNWELWEDVPGLPGRTAWISRVSDPSPAHPDWLQVTFPCPRLIDRVVALTYLPAVNPSPRNYHIDALVDGTWRTVALANDAFTWVLFHRFPQVRATAIRLVITGLNDGWHGDRRWMSILMGPGATRYTASATMISELEAYGPPPAVQVQTSVDPVSTAIVPDHGTMTISVHRRLGGPAGTRLVVHPPTGWTAKPAVMDVDLASGAATATSVLTPPSVIDAGPVTCAATAVGPDGTVLDDAGASIQVAPPVSLVPQVPGIATNGPQGVAVVVANLTDQPVHGVVHVDVNVPTGLAPVPDGPVGPIPPHGSATVALAVPGLDLNGHTVRLTWSAVVAGIRVQVPQVISLRSWLVMGPFPNVGGAGFATAYPPEPKADTTVPCPVPGQAAPVAWKTVVCGPTGYVDLLGCFQPHENVCAYGVCYVHAAADRDLTLSGGSDDGMKAWINGKVVVSHDVQRGAAPGQEQVPVHLHRGWNQIELKITQFGGGWGFYCDLLDDTGEPAAGLTYRVLPAAAGP